jgi:hypothetical protein
MKNNKSILIIKIVKSNIILELINEVEEVVGKKIGIIDKLQWKDDGNTSRELLKKIDKFLQKNNLIVRDLLKVKTEIDKEQKYTLARIVQVVAKTINYCL